MTKRVQFLSAAWLVILALVLRGYRLERAGLQHFDEGVYAIGGLWLLGAAGGPILYVNQHFYAPLLLPFSIGVAYWLLGVSDLAALAVSVVAGAAGVLAVWWIARRWYGPAAGLATGCLAVLSDFHIVFSRVALTDVLLTTLLVLAVGMMREALVKGSLRWAAAAGVLAALAWNTKYNGWLPLVFGLAALLATAIPLKWVGGWTGRPLPRRTRRRAACWALAVLVGCAGYLPWYLSVERQEGGYAALVQHHRGYVTGWSGWWPNLNAHAAMQRYLDGWPSRVAPAVAVLVTCLGCGVGARWRQWRVWVVGAGMLVAALHVTGIGLLVLLAAAMLLADLRRLSVETWLCGAWLLVLAVLTPLYHPYARLALPWTAGVWVAAGGFIGCRLVPWLGGRAEDDPSVGAGGGAPRTPRLPMRPILVIGSLAGVALVAVHRPGPVRVRTWQATDGLRTAVASLSARVPGAGRILVHGEPPVVYYLGGRGGPLENLESLNRAPLAAVRRYLLVGPHNRDAPATKRFLTSQDHRVRLVHFEVFPLGDAVLLDLRGGRGAARNRSGRLDLYEVLPVAVD